MLTGYPRVNFHSPAVPARNPSRGQRDPAANVTVLYNINYINYIKYLQLFSHSLTVNHVRVKLS
jgi:hypothetical protein